MRFYSILHIDLTMSLFSLFLSILQFFKSILLKDSTSYSKWLFCYRQKLLNYAWLSYIQPSVQIFLLLLVVSCVLDVHYMIHKHQKSHKFSIIYIDFFSLFCTLVKALKTNENKHQCLIYFFYWQCLQYFTV